MKNLLILCLTAYLLVSCTEDEITLPSEFPSRWNLIAMGGQTPDSLVSGEAMEWQETYRFQVSDSSFVKEREVEDTAIQASGTFTIEPDTLGRIIRLTYSNENTIIGNCQENLEEILRWDDGSEFLVSTWSSCDGPVLIYGIDE